MKDSNNIAQPATDVYNMLEQVLAGGNKTALIGCEYSGRVRDEFDKLHGWAGVSCDLLPTDKPGNHYQGNVLDIINRAWDFKGMHPECTYMTNSGVCWLYNKDGSKNVERWIKLEEAVKFFNLLKDSIEVGYLENPIPHKYARDGFYSVVTGEWVRGIGKYDQIIQPYEFGHPESKRTCLWLKGLPKLKHTNNVKAEFEKLPKNQAQRLHYLPPSPDRWKIRSTTFKGIAEAMADQWAGYLL